MIQSQQKANQNKQFQAVLSANVWIIAQWDTIHHHFQKLQKQNNFHNNFKGFWMTLLSGLRIKAVLKVKSRVTTSSLVLSAPRGNL